MLAALADHSSSFDLAYTYMPKNSTRYHFSIALHQCVATASVQIRLTWVVQDMTYTKLNFMPDGTAVIVAKEKAISTTVCPP